MFTRGEWEIWFFRSLQGVPFGHVLNTSKRTIQRARSQGFVNSLVTCALTNLIRVDALVISSPHLCSLYFLRYALSRSRCLLLSAAWSHVFRFLLKPLHHFLSLPSSGIFPQVSQFSQLISNFAYFFVGNGILPHVCSFSLPKLSFSLPLCFAFFNPVDLQVRQVTVTVTGKRHESYRPGAWDSDEK